MGSRTFKSTALSSCASTLPMKTCSFTSTSSFFFSLAPTHHGVLQEHSIRNNGCTHPPTLLIHTALSTPHFVVSQRHIFKLEQAIYDKENIDWTKIDFADNQGCLDLIAKKPVGVLHILDDESNFPRSVPSHSPSACAATRGKCVRLSVGLCARLPVWLAGCHISFACLLCSVLVAQGNG